MQKHIRGDLLSHFQDSLMPHLSSEYPGTCHTILQQNMCLYLLLFLIESLLKDPVCVLSYTKFARTFYAMSQDVAQNSYC